VAMQRGSRIPICNDGNTAMRSTLSANAMPINPDGGAITVTAQIPFSLSAVPTTCQEITTYYRIDDGEWNMYVEPFDLQSYANGYHTITFYSKNVLDVAESMQTQVVYKVDGPTISYVYLPVVMIASQPTSPDLVVKSINISSDEIVLIIQNVGSVTIDTGFWVDLYINPDNPPTGTNQTWETNGGEGLVWGVEVFVVPGELLTLTLNSPYYAVDESNFSGTIENGSTLYAQVDSAGYSTYGAILESNETNNILGPIVTTVAVTPVIQQNSQIFSDVFIRMRR